MASRRSRNGKPKGLVIGFCGRYHYNGKKGDGHARNDDMVRKIFGLEKMNLSTESN